MVISERNFVNRLHFARPASLGLVRAVGSVKLVRGEAVLIFQVELEAFRVVLFKCKKKCVVVVKDFACEFPEVFVDKCFHLGNG